jgi:ankyrin repeat protein
MLLEHGAADVDTRGDRSRSALHLAMANGRLEVVRALVDSRANIDARRVGSDAVLDVDVHAMLE